jgi:hypothetical protein
MIITVKDLRELLAGLNPNMLIDVSYPGHQNGPGVCYETTDVCNDHVTAPFEKFDGKTAEIFVLDAFGPTHG